MFVLLLTYQTSLDEIDKLIPEHVEYLERNYRAGTFLLSGRQVPRTGGMILAVGDDVEAITKITETDPFVPAGAARYTIIQVAPTLASEALGAALAAAGLDGIRTVAPNA